MGIKKNKKMKKEIASAINAQKCRAKYKKKTGKSNNSDDGCYRGVFGNKLQPITCTKEEISKREKDKQ